MSNVIPEGWKRKDLNSCMDLLTDFEANGSFATVKENVIVSDVKSYAWYVRATDLEKKSSLNEVKYVDKHSYDFLNKTRLQGQEVLVAKRGEIGKVYYFQGSHVPATLAPNLYLLKLNAEVDSKYIYYVLASAEGRASLVRINASTTMGALYKNDVKQLTYNIPPLPEQKKIAAILTSVDDVIEKTQAQIDKLKDLKAGMMQELLTRGVGVDGKPYTEFKDAPVGRIPKGWEVVEFKDIFHTYKYGPRFSAKDYDELGNVKTIRGTDLSSDGIIKYSQVPVAKLENKLVTQNALKHGDLVMITTADCGATAVFESQPIPYIASAYAIKLTPKKGLNSKYINYFMQTKDALSQVDSFVRKGTVANLPGSDVMSIKLALPSLDEQNKVVRILEKLDENITLKLRALDSKRRLKKALMQDLLTGKVRVKVDS